MRISPIKRVAICAYCESGVIHFIDPLMYKNDVIAEQDSNGRWKCGNCQERETQDMIVRAAPNSPRAKEIIKEHTTEVNKHNEAARRLNQMSGHEAMKLKRNRFLK